MAMILKGRLSGFQRQKLQYLLDMLYTPSELACEIGVTPRQMTRVYLRLGCPVVFEGGRRFINGRVFADWYEATYPKQGLRSDEGFCLTCKKAVKMVKPVQEKSGRLIYVVFSCPRCGRRISRILERVKK